MVARNFRKEGERDTELAATLLHEAWRRLERDGYASRINDAGERRLKRHERRGESRIMGVLADFAKTVIGIAKTALGWQLDSGCGSGGRESTADRGAGPPRHDEADDADDRPTH